MQNAMLLKIILDLPAKKFGQTNMFFNPFTLAIYENILSLFF